MSDSDWARVSRILDFVLNYPIEQEEVKEEEPEEYIQMEMF